MGMECVKSVRFICTLVLTALFASLVLVESAWSIPTFARKYRTSCQTCHVAYPKLNAFGEAYRLNGYQIPGGDADEDEVYIKEEPVSLGAPAYKRVFPNAVWPNAIPGTVPVSFRASTRFDYKPNNEGAAKTDFVSPEGLSLLLGGTLGEDISIYGDVGLFEEGSGETDIGRLFVQFDSLFEEKFGRGLLNLKVGRFEPAAVPFSSHRRLSLSNYIINAFTITAANFGLIAEATESADGHDDGGDAHLRLEEDDDHGDDDHGDDPVDDDHGDDDHGDDPVDDDHGDDDHGDDPGDDDHGEDDHGDDDHGEESPSLRALRKDYVADLPESSIFGGGGHHGSGLAFARSQSGIEVNGVVKDRLFYATGLVNGNGSETSGDDFDNNSNKDYYFRLAYKFGGMPLSGKVPEEGLSDSGKNWRDNSLRLGAFSFLGDADGSTFSGFVPGSNIMAELGLGDYSRYGVDFSWWWRDLNLFGAYLRGKDEVNVESAMAVHEDGATEAVDGDSLGFDDHEFSAWFVEADYVLYPWLQPFVRYDSLNRDDFGDSARVVPGATFLIRANMKLTVESQFYLDDSDSNTYMASLDYAF